MKKIVSIILIVAVVFGIYKLLSRSPDVAVPDFKSSDMVLFWGDTCPHCEKVRQYISQNKLDTKIKIVQKEVYESTDNQKIMTQIVKNNCPQYITDQGIGVPLAYFPGTKTCLLGDQPIIDWLSKK